MYVCICHAVTEDDVHGHISAGAASAKEIRAACGMRPGCGSCTKRLCALVSQRRTPTELADALADLDTADLNTADLDTGVVTAA